MDAFPEELNEQHLKDMQDQWDVKQAEQGRDQARKWRKDFAAAFLALKGNEHHLKFSFPPEMNVGLRRLILKEIRSRFPSKKIIPQLTADLAERMESGPHKSQQWTLEVVETVLHYTLKLRD